MPPTSGLHNHSGPLPWVQMPTLPSPSMPQAAAEQHRDSGVVSGKRTANPTICRCLHFQAGSLGSELGSIESLRGRFETIRSENFSTRQWIATSCDRIAGHLLGQGLTTRACRHHMRCPQHSQSQSTVDCFDNKLGQGRWRRCVHHKAERRRIHVGGLHVEEMHTHCGGPECMTVNSARVTARPVETSHDWPRAHFSNAMSPVLSAVA